MPLIIRRAAPKTRYSNILVLVILFSLFLVPLCAAEEKNSTTPAAGDTVVSTPGAGDTAAAPPAGDKGDNAPAAEGKDTAALADGEEPASPPAAEEKFSISPATLTVYAVQGDTTERSILFLKTSSETKIDHIQVVPLALTRADNREVIPASSIHPGTPVLLDPPNGLTIPVTFAFNTSAPGEYAGHFVINSNASATLMPVQVKLKDRPWLPALILAFFTAFSVLFYDYAIRGVKTDRLRVKINSITSRLSHEFPKDSPTEKYTKFFFGKISRPLAEAVRKLEERDYDTAESFYKTAEAVWNHWILSRDHWQIRLDETVTMENAVKELDTRVKKKWPEECPAEKFLPFVDHTIRKLDSIWEQASGTDPATASSTTPEATRAQLEILNTHRTLFEHCYTMIQEIPVHPDNVHVCIRDLRKELRDYTFDDTDENIGKFLSSFNSHCIACAKDAGDPKSELRISPVIMEFISRQTHKPDVPGPGPGEKLSAWQRFCRGIGDRWHGICQWVGRRWKGTWQWIWRNIPLSPSQKIRLFELLHSVFLPALILFIMGFTQLYANNLTFGANGAGDYFSLVLWGFATGATSEPLAQLIKDRTPAP